MSIFTTARRNEVFMRVAKWDGDNKHMFIHAAFDRVKLLGHEYSMPRSFCGGQGGAVSLYPVNGTNVIEDLEAKGDRDFFYTELNPIVITEGELGDYRGNADDWRGCFQLGLI